VSLRALDSNPKDPDAFARQRHRRPGTPRLES
jgi:hypothetical protein